MDLLVHIAQGMVGAWLYFALRGWTRKRLDPRPHKWVCPIIGCTFKIETNNEMLTLIVRTNHEMGHLE